MTTSQPVSKERGATLVEFALVFPLFAFFIFSIIDGSAAFYSRNTIGISVADSARNGAIAARSPGADAVIVEEILQGKDLAVATEIETVVIYKADSYEADPPASCQAGTPSSVCTVYTRADLENAIISLPPCSGWCAGDRRADDLLGVWVRSEHSGLSGLSFFNFTWRDRAITLVEPEIL